ncbi:hypothetical protein MMC16_005398 [Acarospora aff. strigata]|nr:hypothetical protein [Acarospora aff. strigata]
MSTLIRSGLNLFTATFGLKAVLNDSEFGNRPCTPSVTLYHPALDFKSDVEGEEEERVIIKPLRTAATTKSTLLSSKAEARWKLTFGPRSLRLRPNAILLQQSYAYGQQLYTEDPEQSDVYKRINTGM